MTLLSCPPLLNSLRSTEPSGFFFFVNTICDKVKRTIMYKSTKTYGNDRGLSCAFRQWKATHSHCSKVHGYALGFKFVFTAKELGSCNWVQDFGNLGPLKDSLAQWFDHTTVVALDDPFLSKFNELDKLGVLTLRVMPQVGCEAFAQFAFELARAFVLEHNPRVTVESCEVFEHAANSAIYEVK